VSSSVNWGNPYAKRDGRWLKGNLHAHTSPASGCGRISVEECVERYVECGYDFLAVSDHCVHTRHADKRITLIDGVEWHSDSGCHTGVYSLDVSDIEAAIAVTDHDILLNNLADTGALVVLNHPNWQLTPHYRREELEAKQHYDGIEIYNAVIERLPGYAIATDKWDYLLARGRKVLGFATDDSHCDTDIGFAAIYVRSKSRTPKAIMAAMKAGNFYASSGALIDDIRCEDGIIDIETPDAQQIEARSDGGMRIACVNDRGMRFDMREVKRRYVRFTVYGTGSAMAWTQPFFLDAGTKRP
jgi:hypothetical protein